MVFQDPTGALNARQTIYEAVAEGVRIQGVPGDEEQLVAQALVARRAAPARALLRPLPLRDLRRPAPARDHRRGDGAEPEPARGRRAGVEPRRLGARRDPRAHAAAWCARPSVAILVVTHDLGLAWNVADRVAVMYLGRIVEQGTTEEVLTAPRHPYTRALLSVVPEVAHVEPQILAARRPTRRGSRPAAAFTRAARSWPRARRRGWASRSAAAARTWRSRRCPTRRTCSWPATRWPAPRCRHDRDAALPLVHRPRGPRSRARRGCSRRRGTTPGTSGSSPSRARTSPAARATCRSSSCAIATACCARS